MKCRRRSFGLSAMVLAGVLGASSPAWAQIQNRLEPSIIISTTINESQQSTIFGYIDNWSQKLIEGEDSEVVTARRRLAEPLGTGGASATFIREYAMRLGERLAPATSSPRLIVRLNAMVVASKLTGETAMPLIRQGLSDESSAVRYWAAKAVRDIATGDDLDTSLQMELLDQLTTLLNNENAVPVVQQLMIAIVELNVPAATDELLSALNQRVTMHYRNPGQPLDAERAGLQRLFPKLISAASNNQPVTTSITRIAQASLRYVELVATQLDEGTVPAAQQEGYRQLVLLGDMILRWAQENMAGSRPAPAAIENAVRAGDWKFVRVQINQWKAVLREHPFNLANSDLSLSGE